MGKLLTFLLWAAAILGILIGAARLTAIRWWRVPTDDPMLEASVTPTLRGGDLVLLWRATPPSFGALVVCPDPEEPSRVVIGRIVGEETDTVTIEGDRLEVNNRKAQTESACTEVLFEVQDPATGTVVEQYCDIEALGGVAHMRGMATTRGALKTVRTVSEGNVFLVSDNRAYPYDSRRYGAVVRDTCKESVFFRVVSMKGFSDVKNRLTYVR